MILDKIYNSCLNYFDEIIDYKVAIFDLKISKRFFNLLQKRKLSSGKFLKKSFTSSPVTFVKTLQAHSISS